ncbi:polyprenyl synthetase family protein [Streptomyces sp. HNM0574]|uniref:polyprenyl synthetase family protein n=1 Tax=Streptomyces sp. HNM0574 TaxID=2714954 RepID=UPI001469EA8C|nr:polyprenyl synthetase family protein [Streptomyces sp. HNM0574]NLU67822.1 polyprenyl synthetase family protein [Streptomyces sp. HNM0574]
MKPAQHSATTTESTGTCTCALTPEVSAPEVLARCRETVRPGLSEAVGQLHALPREMAAFSLGWCEPGGTPSGRTGAGGKGVRQALTVLCAEAFGAPAAEAVPGAVAVELIHTFSLLHDDIMDGDELRRQRPTVWKAYGTGPAVLAGDALFALAMETLTTSAGPYAPEAVRRLTRALGELVRGQAEDLTFEDRPWTGEEAVRPEEYRTMAEHKTGSLLGCAAATGAVLAGAPRHTADVLDRAGRHLGIAFQAVDDLLGIWGDPQVTGKAVHNDLRQRKKTFPVLAALSSGGPAAQELGELLTSDAMSGPTPDSGTLRRAAALVERADGRSATLAEARVHLATARELLRGVEMEHRPAEELEALLPYLIDRSL